MMLFGFLWKKFTWLNVLILCHFLYGMQRTNSLHVSFFKIRHFHQLHTIVHMQLLSKDFTFEILCGNEQSSNLNVEINFGIWTELLQRLSLKAIILISLLFFHIYLSLPGGECLIYPSIWECFIASTKKWLLTALLFHWWRPAQGEGGGGRQPPLGQEWWD